MHAHSSVLPRALLMMPRVLVMGRVLVVVMGCVLVVVMVCSGTA
jgi:hypothetical protein